MHLFLMSIVLLDEKCTEAINVLWLHNDIHKQLVAPPSYKALGTLADNAEGPVAAYQESKEQDSRQNSCLLDGIDEVLGFSLEAFVNALVAFIVSNDQIWKHVMEIWEDHLKQLSKEMQGALGKISFMCDMWLNANLVPFMAVMAHWIETKEIHPPNDDGLDKPK
ncbi:hypothetical protein IW262DRAFT_1302111 [Armillaria fumosa]|nr:hypothetical protein IW262DRAFT_1302111 [Armillaria fumosa]